MRGVKSVGILWTGLEKALVYGINFVQGVILARLLCPEDFGLTAMLGIFLGLGGTLAESGLGTALVIGVKGRGDGVRRLERQVLGWNVGTAVGIYAVLALVAPWCAAWYGKPLLTPILRAMAAGLVINAFSVVATARLTREESFGRLAGVNGLSTILGASAAIVLAWAGCGVWSIVGLGLVSAIFRTGFAWLAARGCGNENEATSTAGCMDFGAALKYGWKLMVSSVIHVVYMESYNMVIGKMWTPAAVGLFARGQRWARLPGEVVNDAVGRVSLPALSRMNGSGALRFALINAALLWPGLAVLWIWAPQIVGLVLGEQWLDCVPYLRILIVGQFFTVGGNIALQQLRAKGRSDLVLKTDLWKKPIGFAALACGIPFGVAGLCWAKVVSDVAECVVDVVFAIQSCRQEQRGRCLADMNFVYRSKADLRPWLWRFEVLIWRPRLSPLTHADTWCHYLIALLECGKQKRFDRIWNRYFRRGGRLSFMTNYFRLAEVAVARGCTDPDVLRTVSVWRRLSAFHQNSALREFVKGKTVAVVGNGPHEIGKRLGVEIDSHDVVVRINNYVLSGHEEDYGRRTDIWVKNVTPEMRHVKPSPEIRLIVYNGNWDRDQLECGYRDRIEDDLNDSTVSVDYIDMEHRKELTEELASVPTTGALILWALARCGCKSIDAYGCSYVEGAEASSYSRIPCDVPAEKVAEMVLWHQFDREVAFVSKRFRGRRLEL